jgi:hypothetical protein
MKTKQFLIIFISALLGFFGIVTAINYFYAGPAIFNRGYLRSIAEVLTGGENYAIYDPNLNWRALRREQILLLKQAPDVVIYGGSRWQEADGSGFPGRSVLNLHAHNDYYEDFLAVLHLLEREDRLPKTMVLSLRFSIFEPLEVREGVDWREWGSEYQSMAVALGLTPHSQVTLFRSYFYQSLLSPVAMWENWKKRQSVAQEPGPTRAPQLVDMDVIRSDGSLSWSESNRNRFSVAFANNDAANKLKRYTDREPQIDERGVAAVEKLIEFLTARGVQVVFAQTPFHPAFYEGIKNRPFARTLARLEAIAQGWTSKGVIVVGSFDPQRVNCGVDQFIDWHHTSSACLAAILRRVPPPVQVGILEPL